MADKTCVSDYHVLPTTLVVKPRGEKIFSDRATKVHIEDEAAGEFIIISQQIGMVDDQQIRIDVEEWDYIKRAVDMQCSRIRDNEIYNERCKEDITNGHG